MDFTEKKKEYPRSSIQSLRDLMQDDNTKDFIDVYFKERSESFYSRKQDERDRDSSIGVIDLDSVSFFNDEEENEIKSLRLSEHDFGLMNRHSLSARNKKESDGMYGAESELGKQRVLAQQALQKCKSDKEKSRLSVPEKRESTALSDISSKLMNFRLSKGMVKDWLEPNFSPKTPRCFNDELSYDDEDENVPPEKEASVNEMVRKKLSVYDKKVNPTEKEKPQVSITFERQSAEEVINRLEEDEKKFNIEKCGVLHNSQISQFSGIAGGDEWRLETSSSERKKDSIGNFFNLRSNSVSSLFGCTGDNFKSNSEQPAEVSTLSNSKRQSVRKSKFCSPSREKPQLDKQKVRRCVSTDDLKRASEVPQSVRYSNDSRASNSTLFVQQMITNLKPGMSGDEINAILVGGYEKRKEEKKNKISEKIKKDSENRETPKSSKVQKRMDLLRSKKETDFAEACEESKISSKECSVLCISEGKKELRASLDLKSSQISPSDVRDKLKKGVRTGFYSSTPKNQDMKSESNKFGKNRGKALMNDEDWEPPRVTSFKRIERCRSESSEDNDKTILLNSTDSSELNHKNTTRDNLSAEDTLLAGDLTVLSQRIEELKQDSVCIVRSEKSEEPVLLTVIQKLASLSIESLDCSALMPLLREQFPELLSNFQAASEDSFAQLTTDEKLQDGLAAVPGSWIKLPRSLGGKEKIHAFVDSERTVVIPVCNISENWLLASINSVELVSPDGKRLRGVRKGSEWKFQDLIIISLKETVIPPGSNNQSLKISFRCKVAAKPVLVLDFKIADLINGEVQTRNLRLSVNCVRPENYINVLPYDPINFGTIGDQCFDQKVVQISFDGICELPLTFYIEADEETSRHFALKPSAGQGHEKECGERMYYHVFSEGEKQVLELRILFQPNLLLKDDYKIQDFKASLVLMLGRKTDSNGILKKIPIKGSVGLVKFLYGTNSNPLVFRASEGEQSVTRLFSLKNVGALPVEFSISLTNEYGSVAEGEDLFVFPKSFYLPKNEDTSMNITFNVRGNENFIKRLLKLEVKPNGKTTYEIELIGIITSECSRPSSRTSGASVSTKSTATSAASSTPVKLLTTTQSLSWPAVALEKEARQSFQVKSLSSHTTTVRISLERNLEAFKLSVNGENVKKARQVLKPDCPCSLTVVFRPDVVGAHTNSLIFETNRDHKVKILLNGIGGIPNLLMENVRTDLTGGKFLRLSHSQDTNQFENTIKFTNQGRITAFVFVHDGVNAFSLSHNLTISPRSVVVHPDTTVQVKVSQKLRNDELQQMLSDREICKLATLVVITGDEPSRLRIRKLVKTGHLQPSDRLNFFTPQYENEKETHLKNFKDSPGFEHEFLRSLIVQEIAVVVERNGENPEPSILEETTGEFFSFLSDQTRIARGANESKVETSTRPQKSTANEAVDVIESPFSARSLMSASNRRITEWLETLECE